MLPGDVAVFHHHGAKEVREAAQHDADAHLTVAFVTHAAHGVVGVAGVQNAKMPTGREAEDGPFHAAFVQPMVFEVLRGSAAGNHPRVERADGGSDDHVGLEVLRQDLPRTDLIGAEHAAAGEY